MSVRYGVRLRKKFAEVVRKQKLKYACPKCGKKKVKRKGFAQWECRSCGLVFAGGAYEPETSGGASVRKALSE
ncbi:MAG: 50S ribosomal protein L37ae [Candidatus Micrarchaeota archaeon]